MRKRKILLLIGLFVDALVSYELINMAFFTTWQSAFTNANVPALRVWFYVYAGAALFFIVVAVVLIRKLIKING